MSRRIAYCTFGCRLNQYDTETIRTLLERDGGWHTVPFKEAADVYVVNTCSVTARADASARKAIRRIHAERPDARVVVTGCYAQRAPDEIAELPGVSLIVGAADRARIVEEVAGIEAGDLRTAVSPVTEARTFLDVPITKMMERSRAFVKVQEGCNKACSFCIVPQTRGGSRSRRPESVLAQVRGLVERGYAEIVLTGVDVGDYGRDLAETRPLLPELMRRVLAVPGLERLRLSSIEPSTVTDELIELMAREEKFARHFHIPFQSGSDAVLERMNRQYTIEAFAELLERIAARVPEAGIGTDVICGFPGETDEDFQQTFHRLVELPFTYVHPFTYSVRPGSAAETLGDPVPGDVKKRRTRSLKRLSRDKNRAFREAHVGRTMAVLLEEDAGWTDNYLRVEVSGAAGRRGIVPARITGLTDDGLTGEPAPGA
ncbi:MAG: tRNA (N(6)-L-threonylcarbamoyladenosine(37)-C(2))-methylthiotransferase MtaB [Gammaproteobacteria bacterium]|nr:tRNA (N(6)-L-threonylcarbamoyladenosine(37)-C(2))-methylthiotransferase MtaB [Gammaproteobacteria bacterium]NIR84178.1 tRNA (N(6)-L-threonylcarbamoyladenosine(37)-C(2))-methylthiotransferase MtaB [Gammaproteobacteria bacterium]NIR89490.1 tRNA (N(6)-L-threonylcarbamoyladenosine(37)-C(2))-methylthiotransferase MtaB [Gammaproteobacteria bacterium]NIU05333.1 tRNA (N(6)-L-threonylcarbamoyladenosine(37)-C(2))-methylthiotransferase MtaB [Gammaproteobacteria bacterium]NIV52273.1 tRNA (N(6)-L-threony